MTELTCRYPHDRDQAIVSYLYDDVDSAERAAFEAHLPACGQCRAEISALEGVRTSLGQWVPPQPGRPFAFESDTGARRGGRWQALSALSGLPAWAQVAAALLFLGVAAGIANLDVRYDASGLRVRTGWSAAPPAEAGRPDDAPSRAELTALEQRLRSDFRESNRPVANVGNVVGKPANVMDPANSDVLRRVRALVDESERRQQRELALRLAEAMRDFNSQRQSDLVKIDRSIGAMQNNTGLEILRTRQTIDSINNYLVRTSSQQRPQ